MEVAARTASQRVVEAMVPCNSGSAKLSSVAHRRTAEGGCFLSSIRCKKLEPRQLLADGSASSGGGEQRHRLITHPWERCRRGRGATMWLMPGARSKRCRENRPLTGVSRLAERERPGCGCAHQCRTRSLSARSARPPLSRAASPALLARRNVRMDMRNSVGVAGRSDSS